MGSFPEALMNDGPFVPRYAGEEPRADASLIGLVQAAGTWTKLCLNQQIYLRLLQDLMSFAMAAWSGERSYLINGVPSLVFIDLQKLGFHGWQASCHSFYPVPRHGQPQLPGGSKELRYSAVLRCGGDRSPWHRSRPVGGNTPLAPPTRCFCPPVAEKEDECVFKTQNSSSGFRFYGTFCSRQARISNRLV